MPLYDYRCQSCRRKFETIVRSSSSDDGAACPHCGSADVARQVVRFRVGGRGDLRETTDFHGCHRAVDDSASGHSHGPGCGHGHSHDHDHGE